MTVLCFIDESTDSDYHFHLACLASGDAISRSELDLDNLVSEMAFNGLVSSPRVELHAGDIFHGLHEFAGLTPEQRIDIYTRAIAVLGRSQIEVICRGVNLQGFSDRYSNLQFYPTLFSNLLERVNERLLVRNEFGLVVSDMQHEYAEELKDMVHEAKCYGTGGYRSQKFTQIIDNIHFTDSRRSRLLQLADLAVFVMRRKVTTVETYPEAKKAMAQIHSQIESAVPEPTGQFYTIRQDQSNLWVNSPHNRMVISRCIDLHNTGASR